MGPVVREFGGFIDKYIGDAIMALFMSPEEAVRAAVAMVVKLHKYNSGRINAGYVPIRTGIGLNTGQLMLGTIGEKDRMEGTVISDTVNLASRLEGLTKTYGASIVISSGTLFSLDDPTEFKMRMLDRVYVKGKKEAISVVEILDGDIDTVGEKKFHSKRQFEQAVIAYMSRDFAPALEEFRAILADNPEDKAASLYAERCTSLLESGVPENWSEVAVFEEK